ncbi:hypothetical protein FEM03_11545 [Phragmitibacter flavus]|uniref:TRASH domain-containing protein n=1 Tax=Phragmitibacter flavus TaxID=2576071 RepID=A0A5R8KDH9_9BACT|nr:hypothetical protein [Phragmitibacter flavus]TLD70362.1 hypothetical protein FEM03_11545 [Phragmitibacter flavus]
MKTLSFIALVVSAFGMPSLVQAADAKPYPLKTCIVSGEELGSMGKPVELTKDGQEVKLCCKGCLKDFNKDSEKYLKEIAEKSKK